MAIPIEIWTNMLIFAVLCTAYLIFGNDTRNYSDTIAGIVATVLFFICGLISVIGIQPSAGDVWSSGWLMWIIFGFGAIVGVMSAMSVLDVLNGRKAHVGDFSGNSMDLNSVGRR